MSTLENAKTQHSHALTLFRQVSDLYSGSPTLPNRASVTSAMAALEVWHNVVTHWTKMSAVSQVSESARGDAMLALAIQSAALANRA